MRIKRLIILILSVVLIILGAFLPAIVADRQNAAEGKIYFDTIKDVQLKFFESDMTLREVISILCTDPNAVDIPVDLTNLNQEKVESLALDMAGRLEASDIAFQCFDSDGNETAAKFAVLYCQPRLASSNLVEGLSNIFWYAEIADSDMQKVMEVVIDDRSGTVCSLRYSDVTSQPKEQYKYRDKEFMQRILYAFSYLYLEELGEEYFDYDSHDIQAEAQSPLDNSYLASTIRWWTGDHEYGTTFFVNDNGFYTYHAVVSN